MALVLAIEPDLRQAEILTRIVREKVKADVVIVDSRDAAMEAMRSAIPDVMLLSALMSPRDEDELVAHLRTLEAAEHLQTHTIPQLAAPGGDGHSGPARGLLKAFRRKKDAAPVSGCDPDLFAEEIRVFLEQAEQKRRERAEQLQYRPAAASIRTQAPASTPVQEEPQIPTATTSWDSPFEWRKSDTGPAPIAAFKEEPAPALFAPEPPPPADEADFNWGAHLLDPSSVGNGGVEAAPAADHAPMFEETVAPDHLLEAHDEAASDSIDRQAQLEIPQHEQPAEPVLAVEPSQASESVQAVEPLQASEPLQALEPLQASEPLQTSEPLQASELPEVPALPPPSDAAEAPESIDVRERLDAPELFETFVPPPVAEPEIVPVEAATTIEAVDSLEDHVEHIAHATPVEQPIATPEEIEAYGRTQIPAITEPNDVSEDPQPAAGDSFAIDALFDLDPSRLVTQTAAPATIVGDAHDDAPQEEEIDLDWSLNESSGGAATEAGEEALAVDPNESEVFAASAVLQDPPVKKAPVNLGPLATWARLERKPEDERKPGSDMRDIIERLAVPPHIAGVSYARGVRIRRVRVAGTRDRRRPGDQTGPVILSRRALAESRSAGPSAVS